MVEKVLCIKDYLYLDNDTNFITHLVKDKVYDVYINFKGLDTIYKWYNICDVDSENYLENFCEENFNKHFVYLAEWRDKQLNEILNG